MSTLSDVSGTVNAEGGRWLIPDQAPISQDAVADLVYLRSTLHVDATTVSKLRVGARDRFRLHLDGRLVATGPAKPMGGRRFAEEVQLRLESGDHVLAIELLTQDLRHTGNCSVERDGRQGLYIEGAVGGQDLADPVAWRWARPRGRMLGQGTFTVFLGAMESVTASDDLPGWRAPGYDDGTWPHPRVERVDELALLTLGRLHDRPTASLGLTPIQPTRVARCNDGTHGAEALLTGAVWQVPAGERAEVDLDMGELTTAYVDLRVTGQGRLEVMCAECYEHEPVEVPWLRHKGRRDDTTLDLFGDPDVIVLDGPPGRLFPFWFRTMRFLRLRVEAAETPVEVSLELTRTAYPLVAEGSFESSDPLDTRLWETSVRTSLACMHDTFEDCPYYEQLQYAMDTYAQAAFSRALSCDQRLVRRAIEDFARSGDPDGLTASRAPSVIAQIIPGFSLYWVLMVADAFDFDGDAAFAGRFLARIAAILDWFDRSLDADGIVNCPAEDGVVWNFVDWTDQWRGRRGVPKLNPQGASVIHTLMYLVALDRTAGLAQACGRRGMGLDLGERANTLRDQVRRGPAFDVASRMLRDTPGAGPSSVHAQVWGVLSGVLDDEEGAAALQHSVTDPAFAQCSYAMSMQLVAALRLVGRHDLVSWTPWQQMLDLGLTTWAEDTVSQRSDCHAWGSVPLWDLSTNVLGVRPGAPGFDVIIVDPVTDRRDWARGTVPTLHGPVDVSWERCMDGSLSIEVSVPGGCGVEVRRAEVLTRETDNGRLRLLARRGPTG